jgi:hypothetical protein
MNKVRNNAIPTNTTFGGVCWIPSAFRKKDKTMIVLVKDVIIIMREGRSAMIVSSNIISRVGTWFPFIFTSASFTSFYLSFFV